MKVSISRVVAASVLLLAAGWIPLAAQQAGTITGTVIDQVGKPITGASVEITNEATGASRDVDCDESGKFSAPDLHLPHRHLV